MIKFNAKKLRIAAVIQPHKHDQYPQICNVWFENNKAIATNSLLMTVVKDDNAVMDTTGLYHFTERHIELMKTAKEVIIDCGMLYFTDNQGGYMHVEPILHAAAVFPDWASLCPKKVKSKHFCPGILSDTVLALMLLTANTLGHDGHQAIKIVGDGVDDHHVVTYGNHDYVFSIIRPMISDNVVVPVYNEIKSAIM